MASHVHSQRPLLLPRPGRAAAPFLALGAAALLFEADPRLPWLVGVAAALLFGAAAGLRLLLARRELAAVRRSVDREILRAVLGTEFSELVLWRSRELVAGSERHRLAAEVSRTLRALGPDRLPSASPLNRVAARRNAELLRQLEGRLRGEEPVAARGVLLARVLLRDAGSPLYGSDGTLLPRALTRVLEALEP